MSRSGNHVFERLALLLHTRITTIFGRLATLCMVGGIVAIIWNAISKTEFTITFSTAHVGVAFIGISIGLIFTAFITVKAIPIEPEIIEISNIVKFLTTSGLNHYLEELLNNATSKIILISPYIQLQEKIKEILKAKKELGIEIIFVCRKNDLKEDISQYLKWTPKSGQ